MTLDGYAEGRALANRAVAAVQAANVSFDGGAMMLEGGWELQSPRYLADIARALEEGRKAKDALHAILSQAREGLGI